MENTNCRRGYLCIAIPPICIAIYIVLCALASAAAHVSALSIVSNYIFPVILFFLIFFPTLVALCSIPGYIFAIKAFRNLEPRQDMSLIVTISTLYLVIGGLLSWQMWFHS